MFFVRKNTRREHKKFNQPNLDQEYEKDRYLLKELLQIIFTTL